MNSALACALLCTLRPLKWFVTPEVAGSTPVAPVYKLRANGGFRWFAVVDQATKGRSGNDCGNASQVGVFVRLP